MEISNKFSNMITLFKVNHDENFLSKLIAEIRKPGRQFIYDPQSKDYRNNVLREAVWIDISKVMNMKKYHCQRIWKSMRQKYSLAIAKKNKTGAYSRKPLTRFLLKEMHFMKETIESRMQNTIPEDPYFDNPNYDMDESMSESSTAALDNHLIENTELESKEGILSPHRSIENSIVIANDNADPLQQIEPSYINKNEKNYIDNSQDDDEKLSVASSDRDPERKKLCRIANSIFYEESSNSPDEDVYKKKFEVLEKELRAVRNRLDDFMSSVKRDSYQKVDLFYQSLQQEMEKLTIEKQKEIKILFMKTIFEQQSNSS